ncbi:unnamed protein product [Allacma fusca]|uniref:F-box domain-containing protein n=1 Tax=Allacma fusca TaxID=39272 RepID=A0A8J2K773_9HEXA|nr:unnamed protein product [Allacma fusca]
MGGGNMRVVKEEIRNSFNLCRDKHTRNFNMDSEPVKLKCSSREDIGTLGSLHSEPKKFRLDPSSTMDVDIGRGGRNNCAVKIDHPLMMPEILELIFDYMKQYEDESTIRSIRLVNQLWSEVMRKKIEQFISSEMFRFSSSVAEPSNSCRKFVITLPINGMTQANNVFQKYGHRVKELNISFKSALEDDRFAKHTEDNTLENLLNLIQKYCPNLDRIIFWRNPLDILPSPDYSKTTRTFALPVKEIINMLWSDNGTSEMLKQFIVNSPNLQSLAFMHSQVDVMLNVLQNLRKYPKTMKNLQSLKAVGMGLTNQFVEFFLTCDWQLKSLDVEFGGSIEITQVRRLISHLHRTLEKLKVKFLELEYQVGPLLPPEKWVFPNGLKKLRNLEVLVHSAIATDCSAFLVNAFRLPVLEKFQLSRGPVFCFPHDDDSITTDINLFGILWNSSENSDFEPISTVRSLCIDQLVTDVSLFQQIPNPLVNLTELDIYSMSVDVFLAIFSSQVNLERLSIIIEAFDVGSNTWEAKWRDFPHLIGRALDWDEIFTARMKTDSDRGRGCSNNNLQEPAPALMLPSTASLRNLKKLKYLHIRPLDTDSYLTDFFIYNGLHQLTSLQHVCILENYFSPKALESLKAHLLPFCHVETQRGLNYYQ